MIKDFIDFPTNNNDIIVIDEGKTIINLIAFDPIKSQEVSEQSNTHMVLDGVFVSDNLMDRPSIEEFKDLSVDELVNSELASNNYTEMYFPNFNSDLFQSSEISKYLSIPLSCSITLGKCNLTFEKKSGGFWNADYNDLIQEGKETFHLMRKLYPDKEIRILTFVDDII